MDRKSFTGIAFAVALASSWSSSGALAQQSDSEDGRIIIEYVPPKDAGLQKIYELVRERRALEIVRAMFTPFRLPVDLKIRAIGCDGVSNAFYRRLEDGPTLTICYEYLREIVELMPKETTEAGVTPSDAVVGQFVFAVAHEMGHAAFDMFDAPIMGREEDAADQFAAYFMLQFRSDEARRLVGGAAYAYHEFLKDFQDKPDAKMPLAAFSSEHGLPQQRFANLLCVAYGHDSKLFADVVERGYLPKARAIRCRYEYLILRHAIRRLFVPYVDKDAAQKVFSAQWLAAPAQPAALR
jgi:hypothetical protein